MKSKNIRAKTIKKKTPGNFFETLTQNLKKYWFIIILVLFFITRIPALNQDVYGDEYVFYYYTHSTLEDAKTFGFANQLGFYPTFFVPIIFYKLAMNIYPSIVSVRLVSLLFGLTILLIGMKLLSKFFDKRSSILFGILYSIVPWAVFTSIIIDNDGTVICLLFTILIYYTLKFFDNNVLDKKSFIIIGFISGLLIFFKFVPWLFILVFDFFILNYFILYYKKVSLRKSFKKILKYNLFFLLGVLIGVFLLIFIYYVLLGSWGVYEVPNHYFLLISKHSTGLSGNGFGLSFFVEIALSLIFISPIILSFFLYGLTKIGGIKEKYLIFICIFHVLEILGMLYMYNAASLSRYAAFLMVGMLLSVSVLLSKLVDNENILKSMFYSLLIVPLYFLVDLLPHNKFDFYPRLAWLEHVAKFDWNFLFPMNGASGPLGYYVSFLNIIIPFIVFFVLVILLVIKFPKFTHKNMQRILVAMLVIAISYCLYVSLQFSYTITSPSINNINVQLRSECASDQYYVFRNVPGFSVQNNQTFTIQAKGINFENENNNLLIQDILDSHANVCIIDFPQVSKTSTLWGALSSECILMKTYFDKGQSLGYWFKC